MGRPPVHPTISPKKTPTPEKTPKKTPTPRKPQIPSLMSLQVEPPKFDYSIPRSLPAFQARFDYSPLDVNKKTAEHIWRMIITMQDNKM